MKTQSTQSESSKNLRERIVSPTRYGLSKSREPISNPLRFFFRQIVLPVFRLACLLLLCHTAGLRADAAITDQQIKDYAKNTWKLADLTDSVLTDTLDTSYSGIPYKTWIKLFISATEIKSEISQGNYRGAAKIAYDKALDKSIGYIVKEAGFGGAYAYAQLAYWPIDQGLQGFQQAVTEASFKKQLDLYFQARKYNSAAAILNLQPGDVIEAEGNLVSKSDNGWLFRKLSYLYGSVPGYTAAEFFDHAEAIWIAVQASPSLDGQERTVAGQCRRTATAAAPSIVTDLLDVVVNGNESGTFTVVAQGSEPLRYFWYVNEQAYTGNSPSFTLAVPGTYQVEVENDFGRVASRVAKLTVIPASGISFLSPVTSAVLANGTAVKVDAPSATKVEFYLDGILRTTDATSPFEWTWDTSLGTDGPHQLLAKAYNGAALLGSTPTRSVTVDNTTIGTGGDADSFEPNNSSSSASSILLAGSVQARISSSVDVDWYKVNVSTPGVLTLGLSVPAGLDFDLEAYGPSGAFISGSYQNKGVNESLAIQAALPGTYYFRVYGYPVGSGAWSITEGYTLSTSFATGQIVISSQPQTVTIPWGAAATFSVSAASAADPNLTYQWRRNGAAISGATRSAYTTLNTSLSRDGDEYSVVISNGYGMVTSDSAVLEVTDPPSIYWTGDVSNRWDNAENWDLGRVPNGGEVVRIPSGKSVTSSVSASGNYIVVVGVLRWSGGSLSGDVTVAAGAVLDITGDTTKDFYGTLTNAGTVTWSGSGNIRGSGYHFNNLAGGVFDIRNDASFVYDNAPWYYTPYRFTNAGIWRKSGQTGTTAVQNYSNFTNSGTIEVLSGRLSFDTGFDNAGRIRVLSGATLGYLGGSFIHRTGAEIDAAVGGTFAYTGGSFNFEPGVIFSPTTVNRITGGVTFTSALRVPNLELTEGAGLSGTFTIDDRLVWSGGSLSGDVTVAAGAVLDITGDTTKDFYGTLTNAGTVTWSGSGNIRGSGYHFNNLAGGVFDIRNDASFVYDNAPWYYTPYRFTNAGIWRKSGQTGTTAVQNYNNFTNSGTIEVLSGAILFGGSLTQSTTGKIRIKISSFLASSNIIPLVISSDANFAGTIEVTLTNGFVPLTGQTFQLATFGSKSGEFTAIETPLFGGDLKFEPLLHPTEFMLSVGRTAFGDWKASKFGEFASEPLVSGSMSDPNRNGVPNLLEFAFGMEPLLSGSLNKLPSATVRSVEDLDYLTIAFRRLVNPDVRLSYRVLETRDLIMWTPVDVQECQVGLAEPNGDGTETVTVRTSLPLTGSTSVPSAFLRIAVEER